MVATGTITVHLAADIPVHTMEMREEANAEVEVEEAGPADPVVPMNLIKDLRVIEAGAEAKVQVLIRMKEKIVVEMNTALRSDLAWVEEVPSEVEEVMTMTLDHQVDSEVAVKE